MKAKYSTKDFQDEKFNPSDFANNFIEKALSSTVDFSSLEKCNLSELNQVLEKALKNFKDLKEDINDDMQSIKLEKELRQISDEHNYSALSEGMTTTKAEFENLEKKILKFADKSINIGTNLSRWDKEKEAAILTSELIEFFMVFNTTDTSTYPEVFKDSENYETAAKYLYYLNEVVSNLTTSEYNLAVKNITDRYEQVKKRIAKEFNDGLIKRDTAKLQRLLPLVIDFELLYDIVLGYIQSILRSIGTETIFELRTMDDNKKTIDTTYVNLIRILKNELLGDDNFFMEVLDENKMDVIKLFISYIFENYFAKSLAKIVAFGRNEEMYLKYYEILYLKTDEAIQEIYKLDVPHAVELHETARAHFHTTFDEYQVKYFTREESFLTGLFKRNVERIQKQLEQIKQKESQIVKTGGKALNVGDVNQIEKFKLSKDEATSRIELLRDILMHEGTEMMFSSLDQSVQRCSNVSRFDEKNANVILLINKFLDYFGNILMTNLVDFTTQIVPDLSRKVELNENFFEIIFKLNSLVQRVDLLLYKCARDLIKDRKYEQLMEKKERIVHNIETKIERTLQKAIASLVIYANRILVISQEKNEYYIKGNAAVHGPSVSCKSFLDFLHPYLKQILNSYSENIKKRILSMLGLQLVGVLVDHYAEIKVNQKGSFVIAGDLEQIDTFVEAFEDAQVTKEVEILRALTKIYGLDVREVDTYVRNQEFLKDVSHTTVEKYKYNKG